jgi:cellulose synthase/poly-beta-1,6-N-acetylglucosamine synthase-like glycosyltransferase
VTIIIPAYNEAAGISRTLDSLVEADYPSKEIIVVDDGSTDNTYHIATGYKSKFPKDNNNIFSVFRKLNGGKSSAINYALRLSKNDIVIVIDADSMIGRGAIRSIIKHFKNADIVAVGGYVSIINHHTYNFFINCTALEIINSWNLMGRTFNLLGSVMIVPGALGAFRKKTLIERGIYDKDTITEDFDITIKILKTGGKIIFEESSLTYTDVPGNLKGLYNQRKRWYSGNFQTIIKHHNILSNNSYDILHKFGYPMTLLLFIFRSIWSIVVPITIVLAIISGTYFPVIVSFLMFILLSFLLSAISIIMDGHIERIKLILYSPYMVIGFAQILDFTLLKSMFDVLIRRRKIKWTIAERPNHK